MVGSERKFRGAGWRQCCLDTYGPILCFSRDPGSPRGNPTLTEDPSFSPGQPIPHQLLLSPRLFTINPSHPLSSKTSSTAVGRSSRLLTPDLSRNRFSAGLLNQRCARCQSLPRYKNVTLSEISQKQNSPNLKSNPEEAGQEAFQEQRF